MRRRTLVWAATSAVGIGTWAVLIDEVRVREASLAASVVRLMGAGRSYGHDGSGVLVETGDHQVVRAVITRQCSGISIALVLGAVALIAMPGRWHVRLRVAGSIALGLMVANLGRVVLTIVVAQRSGLGTMALVHDWVGTVVTFGSGIIAVVILHAMVLRGRSRQLCSSGVQR